MIQRLTAHSSITCRLVGLTCLVLLQAARPTFGQEVGDESDSVASNVPTPARQLIVAIRSYEPGRSLPQIGAGIILGLDEERAYIATALHVVEGAERIWVSFEAAPGDSLRGEIVRQSDSPDLDLAVVSVAAASVPAGLAESFDRLGQPERLGPGAHVSPVGCPDEDCWGAPSPPDQILVASRLELWFQSDFVKRGSSGGGLFDRWWEMVGLVTTSDPPRARAIPFDYVVDQARVWGVPVSLRRPGIPRAGYRTTIGAAVLFPTASLSQRFPSGRIDVTYMIRYPVSVHAAYLRLAPSALTGCPPQDADVDPLVAAREPCELAVNSGVVGLGLNLVWRRMTVRALIDGGAGRVEGRYDLGGLRLGSASDQEYAPNFVATEKKTSLLVGGGLALEYVLRPRTVVHALGGYWLYEDPFEGEGEALPVEYSPEIPHWFFGLGLKVGV